MKNILHLTRAKRGIALATVSAFVLSACATTEPEEIVEVKPPVQQVVEIYVPDEPEVVEVPSITIEEYERRLLLEEAERRAAEAALAPTPTPKPAPKPVVPVVELTLDERLAAAGGPDDRIGILAAEPTSGKISGLLSQAYQAKLVADIANGDASGASDALVFLGKEDAQAGSRTGDMAALKKYSEALELNPGNAQAPSLVSQMRGKLQPYADSLHKEAVSMFARQNLAPAVERWEKVLLIDPGNSTARTFYNQSKAALNRS